MKFTKMQGAGNDFVVVDNMDGRITLTPKEIAHLCDRHFGVGADGLILAEASSDQEVFMNYYNSDGSVAEMCGNGVRCLAKYVVDQGIITHGGPIAVATRAGRIEVDVVENQGPGATVSVNMGPVHFEAEKIPVITPHEEAMGESLTFLDKAYTYGCASMGNPHMTVVVEDLDTCPLAAMGAHLEVHPMFPNKCNISFAQVLDRGHIKMDTWERGAGRTLACGTGTCSAVAVLHRLGLVDDRVSADLSGGTLTITLRGEGVMMTGPATVVFTGEWMD